MADRDYPKVYSVTLKKKRRIVVEVERYTFVFCGEPHDVRLECIAEMIHDKRAGTIDEYDLVAFLARAAAEAKARQELGLWVRQNPSVNLEFIQEEVIWIHPDLQTVTPELGSLNREVIEKLTKQISRQLPLFPTDQEPLP